MQPQMMAQMNPQQFGQQMGAIKRRISQTAGETQQMTGDVMSQSLDQIMQMNQQIFAQLTAKDSQIAEIQSKLDKCYNAHPELKISEEAAAKEAIAKAKKGKATKV